MRITIVGDSEDINFMTLQRRLLEIRQEEKVKVNIAGFNYEGRITQLSWTHARDTWRYHSTQIRVDVDEERISLDGR